MASVADFDRDKEAALAVLRPGKLGKDARLSDGHLSRANKAAHLAGAVLDPGKKPGAGPHNMDYPPKRWP